MLRYYHATALVVSDNTIGEYDEGTLPLSLTYREHPFSSLLRTDKIWLEEYTRYTGDAHRACAAVPAPCGLGPQGARLPAEAGYYAASGAVGVTRLDVFFRCHPADVTLHQLLVSY